MSWKHAMVAVSAAAALAACGGKDGARLRVSAKSVKAPAAAQGAALDAGHGISIDRVRVVIRKVEVEGANSTCTPVTPAAPTTSPLLGGAGVDDHGGGGSGGGGSDDGADHESCELERGPFLVDLSGADLVAGTHPVLDVSVPAGTYHEIALRIDSITSEKVARAPVEAQRAGLSEMVARGASVVVDGTIGTQSFSFAAALDVRQKREGEIVVDSSGADVTFTFDASTWFTAADGSMLDPNDPAMAAAIVANLTASLNIVHDEDHDGMDDELDDHGQHPAGHP